MPKWSGNYLLQFVISRTSQEAGPNVRAWDRTGKLVLETRVWSPDAWQVTVFDIAGSTEGEVAVAGAAYTNSGTRTPFIAWVSPSGETRLAVRTSPFSPEALCFGPDGSVWALGAHYDESGLIEPERGTLQQYDRQGKLVRELLPRSSFANAVNPALGPGDPAHGPAGRAVLMTLQDRIGILSKSAREWIEVDSAGNLIGRWAFSWPEARNRNGEPEAGKKREIIGNAAAFRANGDVLATFWDPAGRQVYMLAAPMDAGCP